MYKNESELREVISLGKPIEVVDMFLESYSQGLEYDKWVGIAEDGDVYEPMDVSAQMAQWKIDNRLEKQYGLDYNGYMIPFRNEDAMAMLQVKAAFEMGLASTNIEFSNRTVMPMIATDFATFALWFVEKRNGYFV